MDELSRLMQFEERHRRLLARLGLVVAATVVIEVLGTVAVYFLERHAKLTDQRINGAVSGTVEIIRDRAGVPHVFAGATPDLFFGLGVAMAQDRLWQMDRPGAAVGSLESQGSTGG